MKKILLLFLSLSVYNSYASTEENDVEKFSRVIFSSDDLSEVITERTPLISPQYAHRRVVEIAQSFNLPREYKEDYLSQLDRKGWESWIKKYGKYSVAIRVAAKYAKKNINSWNSLRKQIVDDPSDIFKWFHSDTMKHRENFYFSVEKEIKQQDFYKSLASSLESITNEQNIREQRSFDLEQQILEQKKLIDSFSSKFESLEQSFRVELSSTIEKISIAEAEKRAGLEESLQIETKKREALEKEISELREQMNKPVVQSDPDLTEFTSQIDELKAQLEELRASIGDRDPELLSQIKSLSEKVEAMDLDGIRADVENLKATKMGVKSMTKFAYLVNSLVDAQMLESERGRHISTQEWTQIVQKNMPK